MPSLHQDIEFTDFLIFVNLKHAAEANCAVKHKTETHIYRYVLMQSHTCFERSRTVYVY